MTPRSSALVLVLALASCETSPVRSIVSPSAVQADTSAAQTSEGIPEGTTVIVEESFQPGEVGTLCFSAPRQYCGPEGCVQEVDRYVQRGPCPAIRVQRVPGGETR